MKTRFLCIVTGLVLFHHGATQGYYPDKDSLIRWIANQQVVSDTFYNPGLFRSTRAHGKDLYDDNTLFCSSLIALTLRSLSDRVSEENAEIITSIDGGVKQNAYRYRSRRNLPTYNFWQIRPDVPYPNSPAKFQKDKYKVPDDFDDTSVIAILMDDAQASSVIRQEMIRYTKERKKKVKTTFSRFKSSEAYGVWFADKWKQEFDVAVLANVLTFVFQNDFTLNRYDSASIEMVNQMVTQDLHIKHPFLSSPYYTRTSIILYHLARLIAEDQKRVFSSIRPKIINDIHNELATNQNEWERLILYTSLFRLGEKPVPSIDHQRLLNESGDFYWFSANLMSAVGSGVFPRRVFKMSKILPSLYWYCEAYNWTLYLEFLVLSERARPW